MNKRFAISKWLWGLGVIAMVSGCAALPISAPSAVETPTDRPTLAATATLTSTGTACCAPTPTPTAPPSLTPADAVSPTPTGPVTLGEVQVIKRLGKGMAQEAVYS